MKMSRPFALCGAVLLSGFTFSTLHAQDRPTHPPVGNAAGLPRADVPPPQPPGPPPGSVQPLDPDAAPLAAEGNVVPKATGNTAEDIHSIRLMLEQQSRQLEVLAREIARMSIRMEGPGQGTRPPPAMRRNAPADGIPPATPLTPEGRPLPSSSLSAPPLAPPGTAATSDSSKSDAPKAEAAGNVDEIKHIVTKGETLTSIAKHYSMSIADLERANKILDERKLQIGQVLHIPTQSKSAETPQEKKENP